MMLSPVGKSLVNIVSTPNFNENRHMASLFRTEVDSSSRPRQLVDGQKFVSVSFPRWSPDGQQIAFLATVPTNGQGRPQIFTVASGGGTPKQLTTPPAGVQQLAWAPDGRTIGFASADEPEKQAGSQRGNASSE